MPGDFCLVHATGRLRDRWMGALVQWVTDSPCEHAAVYVGHVDGYDKPQCVEARPGGAGFIDADHYTGRALWSGGRLPAHLIPTDAQRQAIVAAALAKVGTPYGVLDIVAIGLAQRRLGSRVDARRAIAEQPWWVRRLMRTDRLICSELIDLVYEEAGVHLFTDGRPHQLVAPSDLWVLLGSPIGWWS
ncbi:hypothetical protein [Nakamurella endophytica]|uniref:Uncharacterized protein n=1 Tax=Nakamurella endophytica TaxID=1748367 RepID=A0A917WKP8_9ACTN|nr:hypothetical protein [Nakamurella endophytica]GGM12959.1 hypothetical protein GCM10011594_36100 [Nakamurella endophytica]